MPNIRQMMGSKFLKQEDVANPMLLTISHVDQQEVTGENNKKEMLWAMHFSELDKPLILKPTNLQLAAQALGSEETESWINRKIVLYTDPNVTMGGKLVGGLRLRAPRTQTATVQRITPAAAPAQEAPPTKTPGGKFDDMVDDIPF